uniref:Retrovirus-related Pol polyprotein from transposon TNT 1-94 n=1 Tax=Tanacetum cinerariifolium TaxID=118510 RepID=A0A6L2KPW4_TANCI|nr:retrovirus-related Pol polyprotein from transposon TNT 1-94 [Tanacetum cinerariifolium]
MQVVQIVLWYLDFGCSKHMTGDRSQLTNFVNKFLGTVKFGNDHVAKIMGYGDYQIGNVTISRVYYVEGLGHNLFFVGQFCDSNLEVAFRQHTYFIRNLKGVDLLTGSRGNNLYTLSLGDMMSSSPICRLSKASKTKLWLWHRHLSHLNFGAINHLARHGLVRGLPKLKFKKDHLCSAYAMGKSKKKPNKPKSEDTNQEKNYLLHMDLCGPMRVAGVNEKKYILVIVDDYSRFTWVKCLRSKDEAANFIIKFLKMIQERLKTHVRRIRTDNGTEFVNLTLREYYKMVGISHETYVARSPQENEAVATACYTQNCCIIRLLQNKPPDLLLGLKDFLSAVEITAASYGYYCWKSILEFRFRINSRQTQSILLVVLDLDPRLLNLLFLLAQKLKIRTKEEPVNFALMAIPSSSSSDNEVQSCFPSCTKAYKQLHAQYDSQTIEFRKSRLDVVSYQAALESVESRLVVYKQNESIFQDNIIVLKFQTSSKSLTELLANQTNGKHGLGYSSLENDSESVYLSCPSDRVQPNGGYNAVPPPITGNFMPPKPNLVFYTAPITVETDHSAFTVQLSPAKPAEDLSHTNRPSAPIIEEWVSDSEDDSKTTAPQIAHSSVQSTKQVTPPRHFVQPVEVPIPAATPKSTSPKTSSSVLPKSKPVSVTVVRPICTDVPKIMMTRPRHAHSLNTKSNSTIRRHKTYSHSSNTSNSSPKVTVAKAPVVSAAKGKKGKWVWRPKCPILDHDSRTTGVILEFRFRINSRQTQSILLVVLDLDPSGNLGKLQPKADIGIFIGYAPTKKEFWIYNRRTRRIIETIHVDFDELTTMACEHSSSRPVLHEMTHATINLGIVPNPPPSTPYVPPSRSDWDLLFQPMFYELLTPQPSVDCPAPEVITLIAEVVTPDPVASTSTPSSTTVDKDAPSPRNSQTTPKTQSPVISSDVKEENHDLDVTHMNNDPFFSILIP